MFAYLAGPDVFRPDAQLWASQARSLCQHYGYEALIPIDSGETEAHKIFTANIGMIRRAQIVIANLDSFRGAEPDSGTVFELGYAAALGKTVCGYVTVLQTVRERVAAYDYLHASGDVSRDREGWSIEDFQLPANLMLAVPMPIVAGGLEAALRHLHQQQT